MMRFNRSQDHTPQNSNAIVFFHVQSSLHQPQRQALIVQTDNLIHVTVWFFFDSAVINHAKSISHF
jgi:hypothetical protein